jgi:outer membrane protein assembly factor BamE (lipoprotein component of BamABCDE complex)
MKKKLHSELIIFLFALLSSCGQPLPTLEHVDLKIWSEDKNACSGKRATMTDAIESQKEKLLGLSENQIVDLLGRPDHNELYKRNQKFYYYFLEPAPNCANTKVDRTHQLIIRFNAMGLAKEVSVES